MQSEFDMFAKNTEAKFGCFGNMFADLIRYSRWRKASKCKRHIQKLLCYIELHQRRKERMVRQTRSDINQLLLSNRFQETIPKVNHINEDKTRLAAYAKVEYFCALILQNFSDLKRQSDVHLLPEETKEAIAGLIFAASRIGELKELEYIRSLFFERFGLQFDKDCVNLRPGNLVSLEITKIFAKKIQFISVESIAEDSVSCNNLGGDCDVVKIEILKAGVRRNFVMKENSKFQGRDPSLFMR